MQIAYINPLSDAFVPTQYGTCIEAALVGFPAYFEISRSLGWVVVNMVIRVLVIVDDLRPQ